LRLVARLLPQEEGNNVVFSWSGSGTLQSANVVTGPYADVAGATSPQNVPVADGPKYYRFNDESTRKGQGRVFVALKPQSELVAQPQLTIADNQLPHQKVAATASACMTRVLTSFAA
jgi:hypothetical protein